jgi:hypothetical protein
MFIPSVFPRDTVTAAPMSPTISTLIVVLLSLVLVGLFITAALFLIRHFKRRARKAQIKAQAQAHMDSESHHLTINTGRSSVCFFDNEKQGLYEKSRPSSPTGIPDITITFPDEEDVNGKRRSGRVVLVRVGEHNVGLEPLDNEAPPSYQRDAGKFQSLDLERIGGLKENRQARQ